MSKILPEKWIRTKVTIGFIIIIAIALVIFTISYFSVVSIIRVQNQDYGYEQEFTYLHQLIFEIIETDGLSRVYGITGNPEYKAQYEMHHDSVLAMLNYLPHIFPDQGSQEEIEEIERLYMEKRYLMDQLVNINIKKLYSLSTENLLASIPDSLDYKVTQYTITSLTVDTLKPAGLKDSIVDGEEKVGFLKRVFGSKKKQEPLADSEPMISTQVDSTIMEEARADEKMDEIRTQIIQAGKQEKSLNYRVQKHESELIQLDRLLTDRIKTIISNLHDITLARNLKKENALERMRTDLINRILMLVGSAIFLMLFFIFWISRDINRSQKLKNDIIRAKERVDKLLKVKEQFVAHMSHEIRTPLTSIVGFSEQLLTKKLQKPERDISERIRLSAEHLKGLVNNVLDFSMLESGNVEFYKDQIDIHVLMDDLYHLFDLVATKANISLTYDIDEKLTFFESDSLRLKQVLINLIGNALKFTHEGSVYYRVDIKKDKLQFTVKDTGIGIPKDKQRSIFKMFNQVNISLSRKYSGTGLGLSISRQIIEAMGGSIQLQSKVGEGSTFIFHIPYIKGEQQLADDRSIIHYDFSDKSILAIDDDEMICQLIDSMLHENCYRLDVNSSSEMALKAIGHVKYDLIMMDLHMPKLDGLQFMRIIREQYHVTTPVLFLTADMVNADLKEAADNESVWVMAKPFSQDKLMAKLDSIFKNSKEDEEEFTDVTENEEQEGEALFSLSEVKSFTGDDQVFLNSVIQTFISNSDAGIADMKEELKKVSPHKIVSERAHKLLTGFRQFKIIGGVSVLIQLEKAVINDLSVEEMKQLLEQLLDVWQKVRGLLQK